MEDKFEDLVGKTITQITGKEGDESMEFVTDAGTYRMYHSQDCCESVSIEDIAGDLNDLIGNPILQAEEVVSNENPSDKKEYEADSFTWTFYKLATIKGSVTIRWYGTSNGYYSEGVDFYKL